MKKLKIKFLSQTIPDLLLSIQNCIENKIVEYSNEKKMKNIKRLLMNYFIYLFKQY